MVIDLVTYDGRYVAIKELAAYLEVSERTLYHQAEKGALQVIRIGRVIRVPIDEARRYAGIEIHLSLSASCATGSATG